METSTHILHTAKLTNNCPECYGNDGLEMTFTQGVKENFLLKRPVKNIETNLVCGNCNTTIYPVNWTEDIERVHTYNKKLAQEKRIKTVVKPLFYVLIVVDLAILMGLIYYFTG